MKTYKLFFANGDTFLLDAESLTASEQVLTFYINEQMVAQFSKQFIGGWVEIKIRRDK